MKALVYSGPGQFELTDLPRPEVKEDEVLIRVAVCGVCKTDLHIHEGQFIAQFPLTPGHEFAGEIVELGSGVSGFEAGDTVVADNTILCGSCYWCRRDRPLYCENFYSLGCTGPGGFAEFVTVKAEKVFPWKALPIEQAAMIEPTACAVHGMDRIGVHPGDKVLLFGAGPAGLILSQLLKHCGASLLVVAAPSKGKLDLVSDLAADDVGQAGRTDPAKHERELADKYPGGFDIVVDATGSAAVTEHAVKFATFGGKVVVYGVCGESERMSVSPYEIFRKEISLIGSFAQTHCFGRAIAFVETGVVNVDRFITARFKLEQWSEAMDLVAAGGDKCIKAIIEP